MSIFPFGAGKFYFQRARAGGFIRAGIATLQDGALSIEEDLKELYGASRFPVDIRTGKGKIGGTIKHVDWNAPALALVLGENVQTGCHLFVPNEPGTVASATITVANSATWFRDAQVVMTTPGGSSTLAAGQVFTQDAAPAAAGILTVAGAPTAAGTGYSAGDILTVTTGGTGGQVKVLAVNAGAVLAVAVYNPGTGYTTGTGKVTSGGGGTGCTINIASVGNALAAGHYVVSAGVYTFSSLDEGAAVSVAYLYTSTGGQSITWSNKDIGTTPVCRGIFQGIHSGGPDNDQVVIELDYCVLYNWKSATKTDDWTMVDQAFSAFASPDTGVIGQVNFSKAA